MEEIWKPIPDYEGYYEVSSLGNVRSVDRKSGQKRCRESNLRWGTRQENEADKLEHGTRAHGERNGHSRLKETDVRDIRSRAGKVSRRLLANEYGVCRTHIDGIINRRTWKHLETQNGR